MNVRFQLCVQARKIKYISCGDEEACALLDDASVKCWGRSDRIGSENPGGSSDGIGDAPGDRWLH